MPKIDLKPNSPEYNDGKPRKSAPHSRHCDMPGCMEAAEHKAPKDRNLKDYYWFCLEHIQEYNKAWNFFSGMSMADVEDYINNATIWDRPTRRYDTMSNAEAIRDKAWQTYHFTDQPPPKDSQPSGSRPYSGYGSFTRNTPEFEAMMIMGLEPPLDLDKIKERYRALAKKFHPDLNREDPDAEEHLKRINMAYTVLKMAYKKFETLSPDRA